ncbi:MAG: hypothetical protein JWM27_1225 [Gemmatimonadetes bacterium]|nr:hypothetical protein [Gemmatimonadota bacterium]
MSGSLRAALPLAAAALALAAGTSAAQQAPGSNGTATVAAGPEYAAGPLKRRLLGEHYRDLWTLPIAVPVLDLRTFAGGLRPTKEGGGNQTRSLRLKGADGRTYAFRSVNKDVTGGLPRDLQNTMVDRLIQDQTRAQLPAAGLAALALEDAAGVLHAPARLFVMPDDSALGEFRANFAGMLGTIEEHPEGEAGEPAFLGAEKLADTDEFEADLLAGPANVLDARDYLNVRLLDLLVNDWDRHEDQYKWARYSRPGGGHLWRAVPRDRDYAFVDYDGLLMAPGRSINNKMVRFEPAYPESLLGLVINAEFLDRRLLGPLPLATWDSVAASLRARVTDAEIDRALGTLPAGYRARYGDRLASTLRSRRDRLPDVARRFYAILAGEPEVHATDGDDYADAVRAADGSLELTLRRRGADGGPAGEPYFRRRFVAGETREVRLFLHKGRDRFVARGEGSAIRVRVVADSGADHVENLSRGPLSVYTREGRDTLEGAPADVNRHSWTPPPWRRGDPTAVPPRDWGHSSGMFTPWTGFRAGAGFVLGIGPRETTWGFRHAPYASKQALRALWSPVYGRFGAMYEGDFHLESVRTRVTVDARAGELEVAHFFGYGNDSAEPDRDRRIWEHAALADVRLHLPLARRVFLAVGPSVRWVDAEVGSGTPVALQRPVGSDTYSAAGAGAELSLLPLDSTGLPRRNAVVTVGGTAYPFASGGGVRRYGEAHAQATTYLTPHGQWTPTLALRAGGRRVWGDFPFQDAATVGGYSTLRGYLSQRFRGDAAAWGGAELRVPVTRANLGVRGDLGVLGLEDAARVWVKGDSPGGWHTAYGGGVWFSFLQRTRTASVVWAHGETDRVYARMEIPF